MTTRIKLRRDTAANWTQNNPVLAEGEPGLELDTGKIKYGNGTSTWNSLDYSGGGAAGLTDEGNVVVTAGSTEHWIATQRKEQGDTVPCGLRYDSEGNLYSLTKTYDNSSGNDVTVITRYTAAGNIAWQKTFSDTYPVALAVDSSDRAYITLSPSDPVVTVIKFEITGDILWKKDYNIGPIPAYGAYIEEKSTTTLALAILVAGDGPDPTNVLVMEISAASGSVLLKKSLQQPSDGLVVLTGMDVDPDENVFITGWYNDADVDKMFIEKLDQDLEPVWTKSLEAPDNYDMYGGDCASDALGNIYVVGAYNVETINADQGTTDKSAAILVKLNSSGVVQWTRRIGPGPCGSFITGLTATDTGDVYLSSTTYVNKTDGEFAEAPELIQEVFRSSKLIVARYDTQGGVVWQRYVDVANLEEGQADGPEFTRGQAIAVFDDKFAVDGYGYSTNNPNSNNDGESADEERDYFVTQLPTEGTALTIGTLSFTESRVPARFVTYAASDSPLTHENWDETITAETSTLVADAEAQIANSLVQSETYQYTFGADGTLTIPNDGDIRLTQTQVGYLMAVGTTYNTNDDIDGRATAVDAQGNLYLGGEEDDDDQPFVMKISPEGDRLWGVIIQDDDNGDDGQVNALSMNPNTGHLMVLAEIYDNYTYSILVTIDPDTGRILDHEKFSDTDDDVILRDIAWTSTGAYVLGGSKDGEFSPEIPVTPLVGSTTGTLYISRSEVEGNPSSWQIGGTGITPFENIAFVERYTGLTGTVRQGTGATFDVTNNGDGTYSVATYDSGGPEYLPGHKIKILGTSLTGPEITTTYTEGTDWTGANVQIGGTNQILVDLTETAIIAVLTPGVVLTNIGGIGETLTITGPGVEDEGDLVYPTSGTTSISQGTSLGSFTIGNGIFTGATPDNDIILTVVSNTTPSVPGLIVSILSGTAPGTTVVTDTEVSGTNFEVGSGLTFTYEGPSSNTDYDNWQNYNITNGGANYVNGDVITILGTSLGGTSTANDLTATVNNLNAGAVTGLAFSGTSQSTTWKIETTTQANFGGEGSWSITYPTSEQSILITSTWQRTFGTGGDTTDTISAVAVDTSDNIIAVGQGYGELAENGFDDLAVVYKFNNAGTLQWARQLNETNDDCYARSVTTIGTDIYVTHYSDDDGETVVTKLDAAGTVKWQRRTDSGDDSCIARTANGNLLVITEADYNEIDDNAIKIFQLTPSGETVYKRWLSATSNDDTELRAGRSLSVDGHSFYIGAWFDTDENDAGLAVRLPIDGSGTGEYGSFSYVDVNAETNNFTGDTLNNSNYSINVVDLASENNYAGVLAEAPTINTTATVTVGTGDFYVNGWYPDLTIETIRDTDGGSIVFADGSKQSTSATDIPQRRYFGQRYTLGLEDRGHHILCDTANDNIVVPYNARVPFPVGSVITIVNTSDSTIVINVEGSSTDIMLAGDGFYGTYVVQAYGVATLLKIGQDRWVISGNVNPD
jgi:hypothetical protein